MTEPILSQRVHILPLGYEYERAIAAMMSVHAVDKALLVISMLNPDPAFVRHQETYTNKVRETLEQRGVTVSVVDTGIFRPSLYIRDLTRIVKAEKEAGNEVFINTSSSGKLVAMASHMVGIAQEAVCYYIYADQYPDGREEQQEHGLSCCDMAQPRMLILPKFRIVMPKPEEALLLECLYVSREHGHEWVRPADTAAFPEKYLWNPPEYLPRKRQYRHTYASEAEQEAAETARLQRISFLSKFRTTFGRVLTARDQIERDPDATRYRLTENGENILFLYGLSERVKYVEGKLVHVGK